MARRHRDRGGRRSPPPVGRRGRARSPSTRSIGATAGCARSWRSPGEQALAGGASGGRSGRRRGRPAAGRRAPGGQGQHLGRRPACHLRLADPRGVPAAGRLDGRGAPAAGGRGVRRPRQHGRVRDGLLDGEQLVARDAQPLGHLSGSRAAPRAAAPRRWPPASCPAGFGSDTGGSIRQPAACCGVVGLKPTYGRVSRYGLVAFASSLDQIGPLTRSVADAARLYRVVAGADPLDSTTSGREVGRARGGPRPRRRRTCGSGFLEEAEVEGLDPEVAANLEDARRDLPRTPARGSSPVSVPRATAAIAIYYVVASAEASSNLARFDGVRYGPRASDADLLSLYVESRTAGFGAEVKRRILLGTFALASGYYEAYYGRAMRARQLLSDDFDRAFEEADVIVCPSIPGPAFRIGEKTDDPLTMYLSDVFTVPASLAGLPAISVPSGLTRERTSPRSPGSRAALRGGGDVRRGARLRGGRRTFRMRLPPSRARDAPGGGALLRRRLRGSRRARAEKTVVVSPEIRVTIASGRRDLALGAAAPGRGRSTPSSGGSPRTRRPRRRSCRATAGCGSSAATASSASPTGCSRRASARSRSRPSSRRTAATPSGWEHRVTALTGKPREPVADRRMVHGRTARTTGSSARTGRSPLSRLRDGQVVLIPRKLLSPAFQEAVAAAAPAAEAPPALEFASDAQGRYALYRLQKGEALYSAVVVRFTGRVHAEDVNAKAGGDRRAQRNHRRALDPGGLPDQDPGRGPRPRVPPAGRSRRGSRRRRRAWRPPSSPTRSGRPISRA